MLNHFAHNLRRFKLVTFDVTDTLLKFSNSPARQYALTAARFGVRSLDEARLSNLFRSEFAALTLQYPNFGCGSEVDWHEWWRRLVVNMLQAASSEHIDERRLDEIARVLIQEYETVDCYVKVPGAVELLKGLRQEKKRIGIISNFDSRLSTILKNVDLGEVDFVVTSYEVGVLKPNPKIFETALELCGGEVKPEEALYVGNTPILDYLGARSAGWAAVLVEPDADKVEQIRDKIDASHIFANLKEFYETLESKDINFS